MFFDNWFGITRVLVVGPLAYFLLVVLLRASGKRTLSKMNAFDFVVTIAIGSMLASTILTETVALFEGVLGMAVLIAMQFAITWLSVRVEGVATLVKDEPSLLFHQGDYLDSQLKRTRVAKSEVEAAARHQGLMSMDRVAAVVLETDGTFSVMSSSGDEPLDGRPVGVPSP